MADVFISYASENHAEAQTICDDLEEDGITCWIAPRDILGSTDYLSEIPAAIKSAKVFLLVLSVPAMASPQVYREVHTAADAKLPILPVRVDATEVGESLQFALAGSQWIDAFPRVAPALGNIRNQLRQILERHGIVIPLHRPRRILRVATSVAAWGIIASSTTLVAVLIHGYWFNLVRPAIFPLALASHPVPLMMVLATPLTAAAIQYVAHAKPSALLTMDALFAVGQRGAPLARTLVAVLILGVLLWAAHRIPPTVSVAFQPRPNQQLTGLIRLDECDAVGYLETAGMYAVRIRVGAYNAEYSLKTSVEFSPPNSLEFCQIWADSGFSAKKRPLKPQRDANIPQLSQSVELRSSENGSAGSHRALFTLIHSRTATLSDNSTRIVVGITGYPAVTGAVSVSETAWH